MFEFGFHTLRMKFIPNKYMSPPPPSKKLFCHHQNISGNKACHKLHCKENQRSIGSFIDEEKMLSLVTCQGTVHQKNVVFFSIPCFYIGNPNSFFMISSMEIDKINKIPDFVVLVLQDQSGACQCSADVPWAVSGNWEPLPTISQTKIGE